MEDAEGYVMVVNTPQKEAEKASFMGRLSLSVRKILGGNSKVEGLEGSPGMEMAEMEDEADYGSPTASSQYSEAGELTPIQDTNSEIFTSPADTPRTPALQTPVREERTASLNNLRRSSRVYSAEELALKAEIESRREAKWETMLASWTMTSTFRRQVLKRRIRKGIPMKLRKEVWQKIINMEDARLWFPDPVSYDVKKLSSYVKTTIEKDIGRTYPNDARFAHEEGDGQQSLKRVLQWYAAYDATVNYCQGMSFVAALLLTQLEEQEAYYCFVATMQKKALRTLYLPGLVDLMRKVFVFNKLVQVHLPDVHQHMSAEGVEVGMFCTEWHMTLFSRAFDEELACRTFEIFIFEGYKIVYRISLSLLKSLEKKILKSNFEGIMSAIRALPDQVHTDKLLIDCFKWPIKRADLLHYEKEFDESDEGKAACAAAEIRKAKEEQRRNSWTDLNQAPASSP